VEEYADRKATPRDSAMAASVPFKYRAFLSYSHRDTGAAKRLHGRLEGFRIDKDLVGRETPMGPIPKQLRPIFRDRHDFDAGRTLAAQTVAALDNSAALILIASPAAAKSNPVNEEVGLFALRHPNRPLIPLIIEGEPGHPDRECFPPALSPETGNGDGVLAADLRDSGDGRELALAKVIARLIGLSPDEVFRRAERERRRRSRIRNSVIGILALLVIAATGSALYAWQQLKTNEAFLNATLKTATEIVNTAVAQAAKYNVPRSATIELLTKAEGLFDDMARFGGSTPELRYRRAWMLIEFARNYGVVGDTARQQARGFEADRLLAGLAEEKPNDVAYQISLAAAHDEVGNVHVAQGNLAAALTNYQAALAIKERLSKADPGNAVWQRDLAVSRSKISNVQVAQGDLAAALTSYQAALAIAERLATADPSNAGQRDLAVLHNRIGDVQMAQGDLAAALTSYQAALAIAERLAKADSGNAGWQRDLSISHEKIGDLQRAQGDLPAALASYQAALAIRERLAKADLGNAVWQDDLSISYNKIGDVQVARGDLAAALTSYQAALAIAERLTKADPGNAGWQRDLSISRDRIGDMQMAQGELAAALTSYQAALAIRERLAKADPGNTGWQRDLSIADNKIGDVQVAQGELTAALTSH
jgi:tetratricopeptide (TPR) repeat protein